MVKRYAEQRVGQSHPPLLVWLNARLKDCEEVTGQRNRVIHDAWVEFVDSDGPPGMYSRTGQPLPLPSASELKSLAERIRLLSIQLNRDRVYGYLAAALTDVAGEEMMARLRQK